MKSGSIGAALSLRVLLPLCLAAALAACGGGGGGGSTPAPSTPTAPTPAPVVQAPMLTAQPQAAKVLAGLPVTFTATASGSGPLAYQWKRNGTAIDGATASQYRLATRHTDHLAKFSVTISGPGGSVDSQAAELSVETPVAPAAKVEVQRAELRPDVRVADTVLAAVAGTGNRYTVRSGDWAPGQLFVLGQSAHRVTSLVKAADGSVELRTAPVAAQDVYADLAFKVSFHGVDYDGNGKALSATRASQRKGTLAATSGRRQAQSLSQLISCISIDGDYTQNSDAGHPEYGYEYSINCPLEAFLFGQHEESGVRLKGAIVHTSKTDIYYDQNAGTQYHETEVTNGGDFTVAVESFANLSQAQRQRLKQLCEAAKGKLRRLDCEATVDDGRLSLKIDFPLGEPVALPVRLYGIPIMVGVKLVFSVEIGTGGEVTVGYETKKYLSTGYRDGKKLEDNPAVKLGGFKKPVVKIETGELDAFFGIGPVFTLGDSSTLSAMELSLAIGAFGNVQYALLPPCLDTSVGARINVNFNIGKSRFWDGWDLFDINSDWVWADSKVPLACAGIPGKAKLVYLIAGRSKYSHDSVASTETTDVYNAQHALLEPVNQAGPKQIRIDLNDSSVPVGKTLQLEANIVGLAPGAFVSYHETPGADDVVLARYVLVTPGATSYGDTLTIRIDAFARGERDATLTTRQVALKFEPKLAAQPYYRRKIDTDGSETLLTEFVFRGDTAVQMAGGVLEYDDGSTELLQREADGSWATGTTWTFNTCAWFGRTNCMAEPASKAPTRLVLYSTASKEGAGQAFPVELSDRAVVSELVLAPNPVSPYDIVTVKAYGRGMKEQVAIDVPNCRNLTEIRSHGNIVWHNWASDYREFTCEATTAGTDLVATVEQFPAVFSIVGQDCFLEQVLWRGACVRIGKLMTLPALVTAGQETVLWLANTWSTVASVAFNFVLDGVQQVASAANYVSETVRHTYQQAGTFILRLVLRDAEGQAIAGAAEFWVDVAPGAVQVSPLVAVAGVAQTFTVTSAVTMPQNLRFNLPGCAGMTEVTVGDGPMLRRYSCTFPPETAAGPVDGTVADSSSPFGAPPLGSFTVAVSRAVVGQISPPATIRTLATSFQVTGQNLPTSGITVVPVGDSRSTCQPPNNLAATGFGVACELFKVGAQVLEVRQGTDVLGRVTVNVASNVTGVTWASPSTTSSGTVLFGETVTYKVAGTNLLADTTMGFAVERCGVSNTEIGVPSNTERTFTCFFNNEAGAVAGQMPGVVKDAPGGQVLLDGWVVAVEVPVVVPEAAGVVLRDEFNGSAIDATKWNVDGWDGTGNDYTGGLGRGVGPVTINNGLLEFGRLGRISTKDKVTVSGDGTIVIEGRTASTGTLHDTSVMLVDSGSGDQILMGETNYGGWGFYAIGIGGYKFKEPSTIGDPTSPLTLGGNTTAFMEYRMTISGDRVKIERGPTLSTITQTGTGTLGRSIVGRTFYISIGAAWAYFPATWDWIRVSSTGLTSVVLNSTGTNASGVRLSPGAADLNWKIVAGPGIANEQAPIVINGVTGYRTSSTANWIWANQSGYAAINAPYTFRATFDLTGKDHTKFRLTGTWSVDNVGEIRINGVPAVGAGVLKFLQKVDAAYVNGHAFSISNLVSGVNTLDFVVTDNGNPGGLLVSDLMLVPAVSPLIFNERTDTGSGWDLAISIASRSQTGADGTFNFGRGACTGSLTFKGKNADGEFLFQENHVTGNCHKTCDVVLAADASFYNERCIGTAYNGNNIAPANRRWISPHPTAAQVDQMLE